MVLSVVVVVVCARAMIRVLEVGVQRNLPPATYPVAIKSVPEVSLFALIIVLEHRSSLILYSMWVLLRGMSALIEVNAWLNFSL